MEEKKKRIGFSWWIKIIPVIIISTIGISTGCMLERGNLTTIELFVGILAIVAICVCYYAFEKSKVVSEYQNEIDDLNSCINALDQENAEMREVIKNYQKPKKTSKKTKKSDD